MVWTHNQKLRVDLESVLGKIGDTPKWSLNFTYFFQWFYEPSRRELARRKMAETSKMATAPSVSGESFLVNGSNFNFKVDIFEKVLGLSPSLNFNPAHLQLWKNGIRLGVW